MDKQESVGMCMVEVRDSWDPFLASVLKTFGFVPQPLLDFVDQAVAEGIRDER